MMTFQKQVGYPDDKMLSKLKTAQIQGANGISD
jgi:hypothetical protein